MTRLKTQKQKYNKKNIHMAITAALFALASSPAVVVAQTSEEDENLPGALEEIIVTAQRREQTLLEVPMAISAFTGEELAFLQADNLDSLQGAVPNLNLVQGRGSNSSVNAFIRGVGQPDALQSFDWPGNVRELENIVEAAVDRDTEELTALVIELGSLPSNLDREQLRADIADFLSDYGGQSIQDLNLSDALNEIVAIIRRNRIGERPG